MMKANGGGKAVRNGIGWMAAAGISAGIVIAAAQLRKKRRQAIDVRGKITLITGSRGLGLAIAKELGRYGARIVLCARDGEELARACEVLRGEEIEAHSFTADLTENGSIDRLVTEVVDRFGRIDILVNNAGAIRVAPLQALEHSDFEEAMNLMFWSAVNLSFAVLPVMRRQGGGHIVNITSIGGRVSVPHLLPYSCAKFALVGFSTGLSTELRAEGIHVLTVVPGLMRTGSYLKAEFKGQADREFAWFGILGNLPGFSVSADYAARSIRRALEQGRRVCTISLPAKIMTASEALAPETMRTIMETINRYLLPDANGSGSAREGSRLKTNSNKTFQALTVLGRRAALHLNER